MRISDWSADVCSSDLYRHRKGIEEAGANGGDVKGDTIRDAKRGLHLGRAGWKGLVRCGGRQNDQVDVAGLHSRCVDRLEAGFNCQRSGGFAFARYVPSTNAGALNDPFVRSEENTSELQSIISTSYAVLCLKKK